MTEDARFAELDTLSTEELRERAFALARSKGDIRFFWDLFQRLPSSDDAQGLDTSLGAYPALIDEAVALWREIEGRDYGENEPLLRAAFIDYLSRN